MAASLRKISRSHRSGRSRGGFPFASIGKPPRPRDQRRLRDIFFIARPPLLFFRLRALVLPLRGGDARRGMAGFEHGGDFFHSSPVCAASEASRHFLTGAATPPLGGG